MFGDTRPHFGGNIFELSFAEIAIYQPRILKSLPDILPVNLGIDMTVDLHDVRPSIIVVIKKRAATRDVLIVDADARRERDVAESSVAVVVVQVASVVGKIGLKNIKPPVAIVIGD